jgi:hypothetical protein
MFTLNQFRLLFGTFRDLNLVTLLHNLEAARVVRGDWYQGGALCPLAHGLGSLDEVRRVQATPLGEVRLGVPGCLLDDFLDAWDTGELTKEDLLHGLRGLWLERQADADAVQAVLAPSDAAEALALC